MRNSIYIVLILIFPLLNSCSSGGGGSSSSSTPPVPYCSNISSYSNAVTITGNAQYEYRTNGNGAVAPPNPIRFAEIRVTNSAGSIIQCGETAIDGSFSLSLPNDSSTATIYIASRADNSNVKAYILNNPTNNSFHFLSTNVTLDGSKSVGTLTASATGTLEGGAFNILDKILDSNIYLRTQTANCGTTFNCTTFTVAPLVTVYWTAGLDPSTYSSQLTSPLSFFIPSRNQLYILGGVNGDVNNSDTDHFDDTIIIHEYGHFIENNFSIADSPGGNHQGDNILDPRLAWSEAFANFFQAEVTGVKFYRDTFGTPLGNNGVGINENLESGSIDSPTEAAEGNFREFAITRALVDITDSNNEGANDNLTATFEEFWTLLTSPTQGFGNSSQAFRSAGLFWQLQSTLPSGTDWSTVLASEEMLVGRDNYGNSLSNGSSCPTAIQAQNVPGAATNKDPGQQPEDGSAANSNQFKSNDFYLINHGGGALNINLSYSTSSGSPADLDLYLYAEDYTFGGAFAGASFDVVPNGASGDSENISLSNLAAGNYMINVNYFTLNGIASSANYNLTINSQSVCPD